MSREVEKDTEITRNNQEKEEYSERKRTKGREPKVEQPR